MDADGAPVLLSHSCATASIWLVIAASAAAAWVAAQVVRTVKRSARESWRTIEPLRRHGQVFRIPGDIPPGAILEETRSREQVELFGIDHQLGGNSEGSQRQVHLLAARDGDVEILVAAQEQRRRMNL